MAIAYTAGSPRYLDRPAQHPETRQVETYTCGHEILGPSLERADASLDVERRSSEQTAAPRPDQDRT
jgi:hypothetical protein